MPKIPPLTEIAWPLLGVSQHSGFSHQDRGTCVDARNVRNYDPTTGRLRGSQRAGHTKYVATRPNGANFIQHLQHVELTQSVSGTSVRSILGMAVAGGNVYSFTSGGFTLATSGSGALSSTFPYLDSTVLFQQAFFVDGTNYKLWDAASNTVSAWTASAGSLPISGSDTPKLICTWRGRIVLSGMKGDSQNWFMSALNNPLDWNYSPALITEAQAVAGNDAPSGKCADTVNALIPYNDDLLWFGCSNSVWQMTGDPMAGGRLDLISDVTGIAFGQAWCKDPYGTIYFFGSRGGLYMSVPNAPPQRISYDKIEPLLANVNLATNVVRLVWDDRQQTVMIYVTPIAGGPTTNFAYDTRQEAFWVDSFSTATQQPSAVHIYAGDNPIDRVVLLGCLDGYVRFIDHSATSDDGAAIASYIWLGPISGGNQKLRLRELRGVLGQGSDPVGVEIWAGNSAEAAYSSPLARMSGSWRSGANPALRSGAVANAMYVKLSNSDLGKAWQLESVFADVSALGKAAGRQI